MTPEAQRILEVFRERGLHKGQHIHPADFGDVIVWNGWSPKDDRVREALSYLFAEGYLIEHPAAFELAERGDALLYG